MVEIRAKRVLAALAAVLAVSGAQQEHAAAAYAADDARRQRHQRQRRVLILAAGSIQKRRKIRRNDGGWASSTINSYLLHGDARTYKHVRGGCGHSRSTRRASKLAVGVLSVVARAETAAEEPSAVASQRLPGSQSGSTCPF